MGELTSEARNTTDVTKRAADRQFRPDIQGLRAIAVGLVVLYHLYPKRLPGGYVGVDVFFVISGYLITGHLWRGYRETGRVALVDFWGRRARRLVPAAALVLAVTWLGARLVGPAAQLPETARQIMASALYYQNWQLAGNAVDYLKATEAATPVQHFWSLSVEEQFYLVWPLLFLLAALISVRRPGARRVVVGVLTTALVVASLAYSVYDTSADQAAAYFVTTTRMWELGIGGLLAIAPAGVTTVLGRQWWLGWLGLAAVLASAFTLTGTSAFPGWIALLPVLGAACMIACGGASAGRLGPAFLMSARPMVFLGGISYSLYLWHWPIINLYSDWRGKAPGLATGPMIIVVSVLLAWLTKVLVEDRVRQATMLKGHGWRSVSTALAAVVPVTLAAVFLGSLPTPWSGPLPAGYPGAAVLAGTAGDFPVKPLLPNPQALTLPGYWAQGCLAGQGAIKDRPCVFDDTGHPRLTVALVGDSVAGNWWEALNIIARQENWKLVTDLQANCPWTATLLISPHYGVPFPACRAWGRNVLTDLIKIHPDVVITTEHVTAVSTAHPVEGIAARADVGAGEAALWKQLESHGIRVVAIAETPEMASRAEPDCVLKYGRNAARCAVPVSEAIPPDPPTWFAARAMGGKVPVIDMNDLICGPLLCEPVVGNVLVFQDEHHLSPAYSQTLAPFLKQRLLATGLFGLGG
jgi:peptidoglycan/LPS O-acetylase OafA/YrhL